MVLRLLTLVSLLFLKPDGSRSAADAFGHRAGQVPSYSLADA